MQYLLNDKKIFFKDDSENINSIDINNELLLRSKTFNVIDKKYYNPIVSVISEIIRNNRKEGEKDTLIIHSQLFKCPGLEIALTDNIGNEIKIISDLEVLIASLELSPGEYTIIDICEKKTFCYSLSLGKNKYLISEKEIENEELMSLINRNHNENLFNNLINYLTVIEVNKLINNSGQLEVNYNDYNFSEIKDLRFIEDNFFDFFSTISSIIQNFVKEYRCSGKVLLIKSSLFGYLPMKTIFEKGNGQFISEFDMINSDENLNILRFRDTEGYGIKIYPMHCKGLLASQSWILSEIENFSIEIFKDSQTVEQLIKINLSDLKDIFLDTSFCIAGRNLVKYLADLYTDPYNNLHLKIETLSKNEYYAIVKNS